MSFKSASQPLCRYCGKKIAKATETVYFGREKRRSGHYSEERTEKPKSKAGVEALTNRHVVSVSWRRARKAEYIEYHGKAEEEYIDKVSTWDGESYVDQFFCNGEHARFFGYACAELKSKDGGPQIAMPAYWDAIEAQKERK